jgi:hypothetical protein
MKTIATDSFKKAGKRYPIDKIGEITFQALTFALDDRGHWEEGWCGREQGN